MQMLAGKKASLGSRCRYTEWKMAFDLTVIARH